jgi:hypothetical protein
MKYYSSVYRVPMVHIMRIPLTIDLAYHAPIIPDIIISGSGEYAPVKYCREIICHGKRMQENVREGRYEGIDSILFDVWARI